MKQTVELGGHGVVDRIFASQPMETAHWSPRPLFPATTAQQMCRESDSLRMLVGMLVRSSVSTPRFTSSTSNIRT